MPSFQTAAARRAATSLSRNLPGSANALILTCKRDFSSAVKRRFSVWGSAQPGLPPASQFDVGTDWQSAADWLLIGLVRLNALRLRLADLWGRLAACGGFLIRLVRSTPAYAAELPAAR
jgi:hypothetical protein